MQQHCHFSSLTSLSVKLNLGIMVSPFKTGNGLIFELNFYTPEAWFLHGSPTAGKSTSVCLIDRGLGIDDGCFWAVTALLEGKITLKTAATGSNRQYLDSSGGASPSESVYLSGSTSGGGSHWLPAKWVHDPTFYTFKCDSTVGTKRYLCGNPTASEQDNVFLGESTGTFHTVWHIWLTHCTGETVQSIIYATYPSVPISSYEPSATYGTLKYDRLHSIWKNTQLGDNQITHPASDFAVCLKTEVHECSNNPDSPWPNDKGSLCGIMWGSIEGKMCAINFTIDLSQKLILFDPKNGQEIATDKYTPTFCMV